MLGECITNSLPLSLIPFTPCAATRSSHPYEKSRQFAMSACRDIAFFSEILRTGWVALVVLFILNNILALNIYELVSPNNLQLCVFDSYCLVFSPSHIQCKCEYYVDNSTPPPVPHWHCANPILTCWKRCEKSMWEREGWKRQKGKKGKGESVTGKRARAEMNKREWKWVQTANRWGRIAMERGEEMWK